MNGEASKKRWVLYSFAGPGRSSDLGTLYTETREETKECRGRSDVRVVGHGSHSEYLETFVHPGSRRTLDIIKRGRERERIVKENKRREERDTKNKESMI